jgi:hypothetical protein
MFHLLVHYVSVCQVIVANEERNTNIEGQVKRDIPIVAWYGLSVGSRLRFLVFFGRCEYDLL